MRALERVGNLPCDRQGLGDRQHFSLQAIREGFAFNELEDERWHTVGLLESVDGADMGVIQRSQETCLALEARASIPISDEQMRKDLDRNGASELRIACAIHFAHSARAKERLELIHPEPPAGQR